MRNQNRMQSRVCLFFGAFVSIAVAATFGAPPDAAFLAAKQVFMKDMKKKSPAARVAAVSALSDVVQSDTAVLLLKRAFPDPDAEVRQAARKALCRLADDNQVRQYLFDEVKKAFRKQEVNDLTVELFRSLVMTDDEEQQAAIVKLLDDYLATATANPLVAMTVIDDLAVQGDEDAVLAVKLLARAKAFDIHFGYRRCVVQAMSRIRLPEAVDFLIALLPNTQGLIQYDVIQYLTRLTKQKFGDHDREWNMWWSDHRKDFVFPAAGVPLPEIAVEEQHPTYYGIPICAKRIVFVLDTSGSMRDQPIEAAKQALLKAVQSLPAAVSFGLVMFDREANVWQPRLVPASPEAKLQASQLIYDRGLRSGTASNAALNAAFGLEPEAIYFLSDGEPTDGSPAAIVSSITQLNKSRRVSIHTIGVVTQRNGGAGLTLFMQPLAQENYGTFRLVE